MILTVYIKIVIVVLLLQASGYHVKITNLLIKMLIPAMLSASIEAEERAPTTKISNSKHKFIFLFFSVRDAQRLSTPLRHDCHVYHTFMS